MNGLCILASQALENLRAVTEIRSPSVRNPWVWFLLGVILLAVAIITAAVVLARRGARRQRRWDEFHRLAGHGALTEAELLLLTTIVRLAGLGRAPETIYTQPEAFERGMARLGQKGRLARGGDYGSVCSACTYLVSLREKLGFDAPRIGAPSDQIKLGHLELGASLTVYRQFLPENLQVYVTDHRDGGREIVVLPEIPLEARVGETWTVRYPRGGMLWEFSAWVVGNMAGEIVLRPGGTARWINRRRFARAEFRCPARVAHFPLHKAHWDSDTPQFAAARLVDLGGPGLQLETSLQARAGDRMLVTAQLPGKLVEAVGLVRHARTDEGGLCRLALELIGLDTAEIAELTRLANALQPRRRDPREAEPSEPSEEELARAVEEMAHG